MRRLCNRKSIALLAIGLFARSTAWGGNPFNSSDKPYNHITAKVREAFHVTTAEGNTSIVYRGRRVFSGRTAGEVIARRMTTRDADYAAAWDQSQVLWESMPGAADRLGAVQAPVGSVATLRPITFRAAQAPTYPPYTSAANRTAASSKW